MNSGVVSVYTKYAEAGKTKLRDRLYKEAKLCELIAEFKAILKHFLYTALSMLRRKGH